MPQAHKGLSARVLVAAALGAIAGGLALELIGPVTGADVDPAAFTGAQRALAAALRYAIEPAGQIFLRLLFMLVAPLIFCALALGVAGFGDLRSVGRLGLKTLIYAVCVSSIAVLLGVALVDALEPGKAIDPAARERLIAGAAERAQPITGGVAPKTGVDLFVQMVPDNPVKAAANGDWLAWMFFALFVGIGLLRVRTEAARKLEAALQGLYDVSMELIGLVIRFAPIGVFALLFKLTATIGYDVLWSLARYVGVVLLALAIHQFVVFSLIVRILGGMKPLDFFRAIQEAIVTAFSTSSSNATLPTALRVAEERLKLPAPIARFVLTIGSTANQNGTALFEGVTVLFLAQLYGVDLSFVQQLTVVAVCVLGGVGTAGVPSGSLPVIALILGMVGVPPEGIGLVLGVDRFLDMCRTTLNVTGDLAAAVVISRSERARTG